MVRPQEEGAGPVHGILFSTVGSPRPSPHGTTHEPTGLDLAMKLHYLKVAYIFSAETAGEIDVTSVKEGMFVLFEQISWTTGRFRRHLSGRPYIKCNDCGARFVEAHCDFTVEEWLSEPDRSDDELLVFHKPVGPELAFSPLIYVQMTRFKCGGLSLGLSWAHVLGDPFSLSYTINQWAQTFVGDKIHIPIPSNRLTPNAGPDPIKPGLDREELGFVKRVDPVGDLWVLPNNKKMATFSFKLTVAQISPFFLAKPSAENEGDRVPVFEALCAIIWKCVGKVRENSELVTTITVMRKNPNGEKPRSVNNDQTISSAQVGYPVADADLWELVRSIREATDVRSEIEEIGESDDGVLDLVVYGARLTFVDLSKAGFYGVKLKGNPPESVYFGIQGVGDDGAVVVLPTAVAEERVMTVTLPEEEVERVKSELKKYGLFSMENGCH
ncbi:PREDICTED: protein ECERIFERUM 26-like [Tarenaya hassleriana]|uniref:protein ECERIFERUM 26-like n=1 Tax=Tarenaya hassleriana TaxID=28532 RepID=UPI00053C33AC|nr:PREDICTED: protein ECERIFERUM 26-like [Tarenaya hassleriana]